MFILLFIVCVFFFFSSSYITYADRIIGMPFIPTLVVSYFIGGTIWMTISTSVLGFWLGFTALSRWALNVGNRNNRRAAANSYYNRAC